MPSLIKLKFTFSFLWYTAFYTFTSYFNKFFTIEIVLLQRFPLRISAFWSIIPAAVNAEQTRILYKKSRSGNKAGIQAANQLTFIIFSKRNFTGIQKPNRTASGPFGARNAVRFLLTRYLILTLFWFLSGFRPGRPPRGAGLTARTRWAWHWGPAAPRGWAGCP